MAVGHCTLSLSTRMLGVALVTAATCANATRAEKDGIRHASRKKGKNFFMEVSSREREDVRQPLTAAKVPGLYCRKWELLWAAWSNLTKKGAALPNSRGSLCMVRRRDSFLFTVTGFYCLDD